MLQFASSKLPISPRPCYWGQRKAASQTVEANTIEDDGVRHYFYGKSGYVLGLQDAKRDRAICTWPVVLRKGLSQVDENCTLCIFMHLYASLCIVHDDDDGDDDDDDDDGFGVILGAEHEYDMGVQAGRYVNSAPWSFGNERSTSPAGK